MTLRRLALPLLAAALAGAVGCGERPRTLVLISVDTLRADRLGAYGNPLGLTPNLDRLAAESLVFDRAFTPAPFTLAAVSALQSARHPVELGVRDNLFLFPAEVPTLATRLHDAGWRTAAVVSNFVLRRRVGLDRGFERYDDDLPDHERNRWYVPERVASRTTDAALRALDEMLERPGAGIFLWVHYQDPHGPYTPEDRCKAPAGDPPPGVHDANLPLVADEHGIGGIPRYQILTDDGVVSSSSAYYRAAYDGEVRCTDLEIGRLLDALRERGLWKRAGIVFVADHGESLGEGGVWFSHSERLDDAQTRIPLLVRAPGGEGGRRGDVASLLDVPVTLLRQAGAAAIPDARGRDLLAPGAEAESAPLLLSTLDAAREPSRGVVDGDLRYVATGAPGAARGVLTPVDRDPAASIGAAPIEDDPSRVSALERMLAALEDQLRPVIEARPQGLSAEEKERLRALGYTK